MRKLQLLLPFALLALIFGLAACGGGGEDDEDRVVEVIETTVSSTDPADCKALATQKFLEQTEFSEGPEAVKGCEEDAKDTENNPDSVEVSKVEIDGSKATADVAFTGNDFDGQTLSVALVEEDGDWKMDEITGFAEFDQEKLATALEESLQSGEEPFEKDLAVCFAEVIRDSSKSEVEEIVIGGSSQPIAEIVEGCSQGLKQ